MTNTIREPKQGTNATSRRIAEAVDDEEWQKFRVSMKGISTEIKLAMLLGYYKEYNKLLGDDVYVRVDNYLKALARGGQIEVPWDDYVTALLGDKLVIRK